MRRFIDSRRGYALAAAAIVLGGWWLLTLRYPPLIVPRPLAVAERLLAIAAGADDLARLGTTLIRLVLGLVLGGAAGGLLGVLFSHGRRLGGIGQALLGFIQAAPPVSWLVLALVWFGFSGRPSVFIVAVSVLPVIAVNLAAGLAGIDPKLRQMAFVYRLSFWRRFRLLVLPSVQPHCRAGLRIAIGTGCKAVVMGEVLTTTSGVGGAITNARLNLEPDAIVAWTLVMIFLYYLLDGLAAALVPRRRDLPC
ncbi:MAG: ABC transporter permease subunit [Planctomycetes bacterium]|nr:ABC transporter permease subunit [Planctomycetota bacterium]